MKNVRFITLMILFSVLFTSQVFAFKQEDLVKSLKSNKEDTQLNALENLMS